MPEQQVEQQEGPSLKDALLGFEGAPTEKVIEDWKQQYGEVLCTVISEVEIFVYRPLNWKEHKGLQRRLAEQPEEGKEPLTELDFQSMVVSTCLLFSSVKDISKKAGTVPSLFEQIMLNSNFINPQLVGQFTIKL